MNDGIDATAYAILAAGPGWRGTNLPHPKEPMSSLPNKSTLTVEFDHLENGEQEIVRNLATAIPFASRGKFTTSLVDGHTETVGDPVKTLRWTHAEDVSPSTVGVRAHAGGGGRSAPTVGKHAADNGEVSFTGPDAKKRAAEAAKKMLDEHGMSGESKGYGYFDAPGVNKTVSEGIRSVGDLSEAIKDAAVTATEESLAYLGTMLGVDLNLTPDAIKKIVGEAGIADAAAALIAATGDPFQPYKNFASQSKKYGAHTPEKFSKKPKFDASVDNPSARSQALQDAVLSPLLGLEANFADRVDALDGYLGAAPLNAEALAEARTALSAVRRTIKAAKTMHPVYATEQAAA